MEVYMKQLVLIGAFAGYLVFLVAYTNRMLDGVFRNFFSVVQAIF